MAKRFTNGEKRKLDECIKEIEKLDENLLELLGKRQEVTAVLVQAMPEMASQIFDPGEEEKMLRRILEPNGKHLSPQAARAIFKEILSAARSAHAPLTVAYLGPETSNSNQAALTNFGQCASYRPAGSIEEVFDLVENDECRQGVVPIENAFEGSVNNTLDLLAEHTVKVTAEILLRVRYNLLTNAPDPGGIERLYSHPIAAAQCMAWIKNRLPGVPIEKVASSAMAADEAGGDPKSAALGSRLAAKRYGLQIMEANIEDHPDNVTRFISIGKTIPRPTGEDKTSILFSTNHKPGALFDVLKILAKKNINMTRIESRPMKTRSWQYLFFVDIAGHAEEGTISSALKKLESSCEFFKFLGSYPVGTSPWI
ncbi:MAG TPA: prephenate dehydratase [Desulfobacteraceae bacterium]|jgi:chorismate mutase / prephenate dehydratase|nr:prephenate dehydratase [Desulfobacteraceae bacterium]